MKTDSTKPAPGLFKKSAQEIASGLSRKSVAPEGPGQAMRMLSFYENRGGKNLSAERKRALEGAKDILREREGKGTTKKSSAAKKSASGKKSSAKKSASTTARKSASGNKTVSRKTATKSKKRSSSR